jgi:hypothetical protein
LAYPSDSLAATNGSARDLAANLAGLLDHFDALRRADFDQPGDPKPAWWDDCLKASRRREPGETSRRKPDRLDRIKFVRQRVEELALFVGERWPRFISSIPMTGADARLFNACHESLRNLRGILSPLQMGDWLEFGVIPDPRHLERPLPLTWDPEQAGDEEKGVERDRDEAAYRWAIESAKSPKSKKAVLARKQLGQLERRLEALREQRAARNEKGIHAASLEGRVSSEDLESLQRQRANWPEAIERWRLREQDVRNLLKHLTDSRESRELAAVARGGGGGDQASHAAAAVDSGSLERAAVKGTRVFGGGHNSDAKPKTLPVGEDESAGPALTATQKQVLTTMARFDASLLLSAAVIAPETADPDATPPRPALSDETVRQCVVKLIASNLAERPEGGRSGARLNIAGRKLAGKIAD